MNCRNHADVSEGVRHCTRCGGIFCPDCLVGIGGLPYCAACKTEQLLDVRSGVGVELDLAGIGRRLGATILDGLITNIPTFTLVFVVIALAGRGAPSLTLLIIFVPAVVSVVYQALMLKARGQTVGKMALKIKVVRPDGSNISGGQAWGRELSRAFLAFLYFVDYLPALFTKDRRAIHDMLAGTRVVNWNA